MKTGRSSGVSCLWGGVQAVTGGGSGLLLCRRAVRFMLTQSKERLIFQVLRELIRACRASVDSTSGLIA